MSRILRIFNRARTDVDTIFDWLRLRSIRGAIAWYLAFGRVIEKISDDPNSFGEATESIPLQRPLRQ